MRQRKFGQRGVAILTAMLTVVLVATLASAMLWQQWRAFEVESAQRTRVQAQWILTGALDWARLILREDARQGGADHLAEPWAVPLEPAQLSKFLAAEGGVVQVDALDQADQEVLLSGRIEDLQARLNLSNLLDGDKLHAPSVAAWQKLFDYLKLPEEELLALSDALLRAHAGAPTDAPLWPQSTADLTRLGLSAPTLQALQSFITELPVRTPVNLNTASAPVLLASVPALDMAQAQALVQARKLHPITSLADAAARLHDAPIAFDASAHATATRFFSVTGQLQIGAYMVQEQSLLQRDGMDVKVLSRTRQVLSLPALPYNEAQP